MSQLADRVAADHKVVNDESPDPDQVSHDEAGRYMSAGRCKAAGCGFQVRRRQGTSWSEVNARHVGAVVERLVRTELDRT